MGRFELLGAQAPEMTVTSRPIVKGIDIVSQISLGELSILVNLLLDSFLLQTAEKGFRDGIVPAVRLAAHTRLQVIGAAESPPRVTAVLRALIGMNHRAAWSSSTHGHQDRVEHQLA
jgi:hypothetical protein